MGKTTETKPVKKAAAKAAEKKDAKVKKAVAKVTKGKCAISRSFFLTDRVATLWNLNQFLLCAFFTL